MSVFDKLSIFFKSIHKQICHAERNFAERGVPDPLEALGTDKTKYL